jgi:hypothetical protein
MEFFKCAERENKLLCFRAGKNSGIIFFQQKK